MNARSRHRWLSEGAEVLAQCVSAQPEELHCDVLIVGSGYGGAVAAARLAGATRPDGTRAEVFVLERGQEYLPGSFPATFAEIPGHVRFSEQDGQPARGWPEGLFDMRIGGDVNVLLGNGLGGGSLINAAVMERATADAFDVERATGDGTRRRAWPAKIDLDALQPWYAKAEAMLDPHRIPKSVPKLDSLFAAADAMGAHEKARANVAITFAEASKTPAGVPMNACLNCGDCVSGCNHQAKQSLDLNYLALARANGARLFCGATVHQVRQSEQVVEVDFHLTDPAKARSDRARPYRVRARHVILAAGTLGSTEILLRSARDGLPVATAALGANFSGNGDMIAVAYRQTDEARCCAREGDAPAARGIGPTITGLVRHRSAHGKRPIVFEEFAIPAALRRVFGEFVATTDALHGLAHIDWSRHAPDECIDDPLAISDDALDRTPVYGMMGDDGAAGRIELVEPKQPQAGSTSSMTDARVRVVWSGAAKPALFQAQLDALRHAHERAGGCGGRVLPNPLWQPLPSFEATDTFDIHGPTTTVHPLGGCPMADDSVHGVVNAHGRVYATGGGTLRGLAVLDGSIVPAALGINPSLTIAALAERAIPQLVADWQLTLRSQDAPPLHEPRPVLRDTSRPQPPAPTRFELRERMTGRIRLGGAAFDAQATAVFAPIDAQALRGLPRVVKQTVVLTLRDAGRRETVVHCCGSASLLLRERSCVVGRVWRSGWRAWRKLRQGGGSGKARFSIASLLEVVALCSHLGEVRRICYDWTVEKVEGDAAPFKIGDRLQLIKRIGLSVPGNPWRQLSAGELVALVDKKPARPLGRLELDLAYFVEQNFPLLRITSQQDQPNAIGDLVELGMWMLRIVLRVHALSFLPPADRIDAADARLPGPLSGVTPEVTEFELRATDPHERHAVAIPKVRLSRYAPTQAGAENKRPVLLIHGYGAGGSTFAHPSIGVNLVQALMKSGREVWVLDLRNSIGLEQRHYWPLDEIAQQDIPKAIEVVSEFGAGGKRQVDVVAHCIGAAMFSIAVLESDTLHKSIGSVVLSQVGPLMRMSPLNRFRGFVASYLQQFIGTEWFDVKSTASADSKTLLIDALLASYPYPDDDREAERLKTVPGFAAVRHRADAIFGQLMQLDNVGDETLRSLDALFGWVMVKGLAQTIHYAREQLVTDASGRNRVVSHESLAKRFGFPLLMLHGRENQLFDPHGSYDTIRRLSEVFEGVTLPNELPVRNLVRAGRTRRLRLLEGYGHQDTLIGRNAHRDVFPHIVAFLNRFAQQQQQHRSAEKARGRKPVVADLPWVGPVLGRAVQEADTGHLVCRIGLRPPPARARIGAVVLVPARRACRDAKWKFCYSRAAIAPAGIEMLCDTALEVHLNGARVAQFDGFAVVTVDCDDSCAAAASNAPQPDGLFAQPDHALRGVLNPNYAPPRDVLKAVRAALTHPGAKADAAVVQLDGGWISAACERASPQPSLRFALASCQYPPGLVDESSAQRSLERLTQRVQRGPAAERPQLLILSGDQVYVDAAAGLFDPLGTSDIDRAYPLSFTLSAFKSVTKALPTYPLIDDHEVKDNYEPGRADRAYCAAALSAYRRYQHTLVKKIGTQPFDYTISPAGFPFYMLDARSTREHRVLRTTEGAKLLDEASIHKQRDLADLCEWLANQPRDVPKFIVSSIPVFPFPLAALGPDDAERLALDDWSGFPHSQFALLDFIRSKRIEHIVLLSGDRHMSSVSSLWIDSEDGAAAPIEVVSIVSSGLYAPWPFANSRPDEFVLDGPVALCLGGRHLTGEIETCATGTSDGYAAIGVGRDMSGSAWEIHVQLDLADEMHDCTRVLGDRVNRPGWNASSTPRKPSF